MPHAHRRPHGNFRNIAQPVEVACRDLAFEKLLPKRELDLVCLGVYRGNVKLAPVIKSRAALADGVAVYALVTAYDFAMENKASGGGELGSCRKPGDIVLVWDEAYLHAVGLVRDGKPEVLGELAHLLFFKSAERQRQTVELLSAYAAEHIALIV